MTSTARHTARRARRHLGRLALVAALALAAGCGGSEGDQAQESPDGASAEAWATDVCTTVSTWKGAIEHSQAMLGDPATLSPKLVRHALDFAADATRAFITDLQKLGPPDTEAGQAAEEQLTTLSDQLQEQADVVTGALEKSSANLQELLAQLSDVSGALSTMVTDTSTAVDNIRQLDGADELESAFKDSPTCQKLTAGGSPGGG